MRGWPISEPYTDLYTVLGIPRNAGVDEIRRAFRQLARENHPDVNPGDAAAEERFKRISFAYEVLSDADKRSRYDEFGVDGLAEGFDADRARVFRRWGGSRGRTAGPAAGFSFEDLLGDLFGGRTPGAGRDVEAALSVDLLDVVRAAEVSVEFAHRPGLKVRLPPGAGEGTRIRLAGQGDPAPGGGARGDLFLKLSVRSHPLLRREGDDLHLDLPVTLPELVRGAKIRVPTPDGPVGMTVPRDSKPGSVLRVRGKGCVTRESGRRGDLYVHLTLEWPDAAGEDLEHLAEAAESLYSGRDVRAGLHL